MTAIHVLGIPGSLRRDSYNKALLRAACRWAPPGMTIELFDLAAVPPFDADVDAQGPPAAVAEMRDRIAAANGLVIATPEYQHGIPGVLKNALDWASLPIGAGPLHRKPTAIMGATPETFGTVRALEQLRQTLAYNESPMVMSPEVSVAEVEHKVDDLGEIRNGETLDLVARLLEGLADVIRLHGSSSPRPAGVFPQRGG